MPLDPNNASSTSSPQPLPAPCLPASRSSSALYSARNNGIDNWQDRRQQPQCGRLERPLYHSQKTYFALLYLHNCWRLLRYNPSHPRQSFLLVGHRYRVHFRCRCQGPYWWPRNAFYSIKIFYSWSRNTLNGINKRTVTLYKWIHVALLPKCRNISSGLDLLSDLELRSNIRHSIKCPTPN